MTPTDRSQTVRTVYERLNSKDFAGVADLLDPNVAHEDLLQPGVIHVGRLSVLELWYNRFTEASVRALLTKTVEAGNAIVAVVSYQAYDPDGSPQGAPMIVVHRFFFAEGLIARIESTIIEDVDDSVRALYLRPC